MNQLFTALSHSTQALPTKLSPRITETIYNSTGFLNAFEMLEPLKKALYQNESKFISVKAEHLQQKYSFPCSLAQANKLQEEVCK